MGLSKLSEKCSKCPDLLYCNHKYMEAVATGLFDPNTADMVEPIMARCDYREIKIAPGVTVSLDMEDIKKELAKELYRSMGLTGSMMR